MKAISILAAILATGALSAQVKPNDISASLVLFGETIQTRPILLATGVEDQADRQTGIGFRFMFAVTDDSRWNCELAGRFSSSANMVTNRDISTPPATVNVLDVTKVKVEYSYWSVGAGYLLPLGTAADLGFHLEGRNETINPKGSYSTTNGGTASIDAQTAYFRPWVRLSLDFKVKTGSFTTIIGGDAGAALIRTSQKTIQPMSQIDSQTMRAMAPNWSGSLFAGIQF